ncbi:MAG: hypothetical protein ACJATT_003810 [Myxococcota bacterium]
MFLDSCGMTRVYTGSHLGKRWGDSPCEGRRNTAPLVPLKAHNQTSLRPRLSPYPATHHVRVLALNGLGYLFYHPDGSTR